MNDGMLGRRAIARRLRTPNHEMPMASIELHPAGSMLPSLSELESAAAIVYAAMPPTPQYSWPLVDRRCDAEVWVKHENHAPVGAFEVRGGLVYFDALLRTHPSIGGVVT